MSEGMNPWANEMKLIFVELVIDFFKFVSKVQKVLMAIKKFRVRNMILLHEAQTSSKVTKIGPVGFWKDFIECHWPHSVEIQKPLPGLVTAVMHGM
jgi:hypothetical protein